MKIKNCCYSKDIIEVIDKIVEYSSIIRTKGLLSLEEAAAKEDYFFLKNMLLCVVDGNPIDRMYKFGMSAVLNLPKHEQPEAFISVLGCIEIYLRNNPRNIREMLELIMFPRGFENRDSLEKIYVIEDFDPKTLALLHQPKDTIIAELSNIYDKLDKIEKKMHSEEVDKEETEEL